MRAGDDGFEDHAPLPIGCSKGHTLCVSQRRDRPTLYGPLRGTCNFRSHLPHVFSTCMPVGCQTVFVSLTSGIVSIAKRSGTGPSGIAPLRVGSSFLDEYCI